MSVDPVDWKNYDPVTGIGDPSTPITAENLKRHEAYMVAKAAEAKQAADDARQAADEAGALTDTAVANAINADGSDTRTALDSLYAPADISVDVDPAAVTANAEAAALFGPVWAKFPAAGDGLRVSREGDDYLLWQDIGHNRWVSWRLASESTNPGGYTASRLRGCYVNMSVATVNSHDATITRSGTWTSLSNAAAYGGNYYHSSTAGSTATWTTPVACGAVAARIIQTTNGGLAKVTIDGSATAADRLPTAQELVTAGDYSSGILVANGGTLNPTDRVLDCYSPLNTGENPAGWDVKVPLAENLDPAQAHTVVLTATGYTQTGLTGGRTYYTGLVHAVDASTVGAEMWPWWAVNDEHSSAWEFAIEREPNGASGAEWVGSTHGYEEQTGIAVYVDGAAAELDDGDTVDGDSIRIVRTSEGLHPDTGSSVHELFTTTYEVDRRGLSVTVQVAVVTDQAVMKAYTMLPVTGVDATDIPAFDRASLLMRPNVLELPGTSNQFFGVSKSAAAWVWTSAGNVAAAMYVPDIWGFTDGWAHPGDIAMSVQDRSGDLTKVYGTWIVDAAGVPVPAGTVKRWTTRYVVGHFPGGADDVFTA